MAATYTITATGYTVEQDGVTVISQGFIPGAEGFQPFDDDAQKIAFAEAAVAALNPAAAETTGG